MPCRRIKNGIQDTRIRDRAGGGRHAERRGAEEEAGMQRRGERQKSRRQGDVQSKTSQTM